MIRFRFIGVGSTEYRFGVMVERAKDGKFFCFDQKKFTANGSQTSLIAELERASKRFAGKAQAASQLDMLYCLDYATPTNSTDPDKNWADGDYFVHYCGIAPRAELETSALAVIYAGDDQVVIPKSPSVFRANINHAYPAGTDPKGVPKSSQIAASLTYDSFRR